MLASLRHPCICQFFGTSRIGGGGVGGAGSLLVVIELLEGSLHDLISNSSTRIPTALCLRLAHETVCHTALEPRTD